MKMKLFFAVLAACVLGFAGCSDDQTELGVNYDKNATVKGYVSTQSINKQGDEVYSAAKDLTVYVLVAYKDLTGDASAVGNKRFETKTDSKGFYTLAVPTTDAGISAEIFTERIDGDTYVGDKLKTCYFESTPSTISIKAGIFTVKDITLTATLRPELDRD